MLIDTLPWMMSAITIYMTVLAGNKHRLAWLVGLFNQALWLTWIVLTETWGLIPMNVALWIVYARNHVRWIADREKGSEVAPDKPVTPKDTAAGNGRHLLGQASNSEASQGNNCPSCGNHAPPGDHTLDCTDHAALKAQGPNT